MSTMRQSARDGTAVAGRTEGLRVLVADDSPAVSTMLRGILVREGHAVIVAADGARALELFAASPPDIVLMDVVMPTVDGIEATRRLRERAAGRWVPVILLSALDTEDDVVRGLEAGADDYLVKPINLSILKAKIRSFQRIARMQSQVFEQAEVLGRLRDEQAAEEQLAHALIGNMVRRKGLDDPALAWEVLPSARFSGDAVAAGRGPTGRLYAMLGDATGHGLAASVSLLPALQVFYGMVRKGLPLPAMVREINACLRDVLPADRYLAAALMVVDEAGRSAEVWNGGMPCIVLLDATGAVIRRFESTHVPLGILADAAFDGACAPLVWDGPVEIAVCSDGVVEGANAAGEPFGFERLERSLGAAPAGARAARVVRDLELHLAGAAAVDDASVLTIRLP
jgi:two-component system, HptB-dependent secretion and biofilm response regulator